jgi:hypothetical protein
VIKRVIFIVVLVSFVSTIILSHNVQAGSAGVGVLNVPPEYSETRIVTEDGIKKIYLTISDYNSWEDIHTTTVTIKNGDALMASFVFRQYENTASVIPLWEFEETEGKDYLLVNKCSYSHSDKTDTVSDRCLLHVVFAFRSIPGTQLTILTYDYGELYAKTHVEYDVEGMPRSTDMIMLPWTPTPVDLSLYTLNALAIAFAVTVTAVFIRKQQEEMAI